VWAEQAILRRCVGTNSPLAEMARIGEINPVYATGSGLAQPCDEVADIKDDFPSIMASLDHRPTLERNKLN
jgi:hypothetical protein